MISTSWTAPHRLDAGSIDRTVSSPARNEIGRVERELIRVLGADQVSCHSSSKPCGFGRSTAPLVDATVLTNTEELLWLAYHATAKTQPSQTMLRIIACPRVALVNLFAIGGLGVGAAFDPQLTLSRMVFPRARARIRDTSRPSAVYSDGPVRDHLHSRFV